MAQCSDPDACNFGTVDSLSSNASSPCVSIVNHAEHETGALAGMTTYRVYVHLPETDDFLSAISTLMIGCTDPVACNYASTAGLDDGTCEYASCTPGTPQPDHPASPSLIHISTTTSFYQDPVGSATATGILGSLLGFFPDLLYDSWITIGHAPEDGTPGATVSTIASPNQNWVAEFEAGNDLLMNDLIGGLWYIYNDGNDQGLPDEDGKVLVAQLTTDGEVGVTLSGQYFPDFGSGLNGEADGTQDQLFLAEYGPACPSDPNASCAYPADGLDCEGNCLVDADLDGVCDEVDTCVGELDSCGVCNGPGPEYACGCEDIPAEDCDCDGNQLDALGVCGGDCSADVDSDGICDDMDDCVGSPDACGICNGPGPVYACGCEVIPAGDCDCNGNQLDAAGVCGGDCSADADQDGICDDVDDCIGAFDACGVCNGPGDIYTCGCADIPAGDCDCDGNELDATGVCGGNCSIDADQDGICDDVDDCVGAFDACGICNGSGEIYACGCNDIPAGDCDCNGNQLDVLGICGGTCTSDVDADGVCDDIDDCIGVIDACGVCNGPGAIFQCGCTNIPLGECDCNGNQVDAIGVCGGTCSADDNGNGICDDLEYLLEVEGCMNSTACNFHHCATVDDGSCAFSDALGICGGTCNADADGDGVCDTDEIPGCTHPYACNYASEATDDDGSCLTTDATGECGGTCLADLDADGICDDIDPCVGSLDLCGICNGPGDIYDCGCSVIPAGDCDCNGNQLDALGHCGGPCASDTDGDGICDTDEIPGCTNPYACNYLQEATDDDGSCLTVDATGECGGSCLADVDQDGICDDVDGCVGTLDNCGVCNGPGAIFECGCSGIPEGDCDCNGNQADALGICGGTCSADADGNGICDDIIQGCTYTEALNFMVEAELDDGSCAFPEAEVDNCPYDVDGDNAVGVGDLLDLLGHFGEYCEP